MKPEDALKLLEQDENLPVLPQLFYQIVEAASNPDTPVSELSNLILEDQVLTGRVLRMANSAYYAMPQKISTITRAVMVLGFITLRNFITAATIVDTLIKDAFKGGLYETFWVHALASSLSASLMAEQLKIDHQEEAMIAGLIHDCGKLFLDHHFPETYGEVAEMTRGGRDVLTAERDLFGFTHVDVGEKIAERWDLPATLVHAIRNHHRFSKSSKTLNLSDVIYLADLFVPHAIPDQWVDRVRRILPKGNSQRGILKISTEVGLSEKQVQEVIQKTKENIQRIADDLNLKFLCLPENSSAYPSPELFRLQRKMERQERQLAMVKEISSCITESPGSEVLIQVVVEAIHRGIGFNRTLLFLLNHAKNEIEGKLGLGYDVPPFLKKITVPLNSDGLMAKAIQQKRTINILDSQSQSYSDLPLLEVSALSEIKAFALVPFLAGTDVIGIVMVDNAVTKEPIRDQEIDLMSTFLTLAGVYLESHPKKPTGSRDKATASDNR
jgi:putative nucleotidyltransferase with HDIG domain